MKSTPRVIRAGSKALRKTANAELLYGRAWKLRLSGESSAAIALFEEAARLGHQGAQYSAAHMFATAEGVRRN